MTNDRGPYTEKVDIFGIQSIGSVTKPVQTTYMPEYRRYPARFTIG